MISVVIGQTVNIGSHVDHQAYLNDWYVFRDHVPAKEPLKVQDGQ